MDFFKSVFSADLLPRRDEGEEVVPGLQGKPGGSGADDGGGGGGFGGLLKTLASRSESMIQTYRRDLEEFGSGLRKETTALREAIRDLPSSLEAGAAAAQGSLESVGQAVDGFGGSVWRGAAGIVTQGKDALRLSLDDTDDDSSSSLDASTRGSGTPRRYSRFEAQVLGIQSDPATFTAEPEDAEDFRAWAVGFQLAEKEEEIESLRAENGALEGNFARLVASVVDYETFWNRYFYRVHKLKQAEDVRANLVKRVISREEEEEDLSWEVDDDDDEEEDWKVEQRGRRERGDDKPGDEQERGGEEVKTGDPALKEIDEVMKPMIGGNPLENSQLGNVAKVASEDHVSSEAKEKGSQLHSDEVATRLDDGNLPEGGAEAIVAGKDRDVSAVPNQPSIPEEDDLGWDEIEDLGDNDERKDIVSGGSSSKVDLRKRLNTAEEDEDLIWDIEDDEPTNP